MYTLPYVGKQGKESIQIYAAASVTAPDDKNFWRILADGLKTYRPLFTDKAYRARFSEEMEQCHLELAGHLFPSPLNHTGQLRYSEATTTEGQVVRRSYRDYLKSVYKNSGRLLGKVNNTLEETKGTGIPIKTNSIVQDLLRILPAGKTPTPD
jgi:hypothetical protein